MAIKPIFSYILILVLSLILCASPPIVEQMKQIVSETPEVIFGDNKSSSSFKRLGDSFIELTNSKATIKFYDDYKTVGHEIILTPKNLPDNSYFPHWLINFDSNLLTIQENSCQIKTNGVLSEKECIITQTPDNEKKYIHLNITLLYATRIKQLLNIYLNMINPLVKYYIKWMVLLFHL